MPPRPKSHDGFSLLELLAVLTLIGLLAGAVALRLEQPYRAARLGDIAQRIALVDQQVRSHARRFARGAELVCDVDKNVIVVQAATFEPLPLSQLTIPAGVRLERARIGLQSAEFGQVKIPVSASGQTPSYAIWLRGTEGGRQGLFFAGLTGQVTRLETESDEDALFRLLGQSGADAR